jgi:hypothetical protein
LLFENLRIHQDSNSQGGSSLGSVRVHSFTLSYTLGSMRHDSRASLLVHNLVSPCFGREPKARVMTLRFYIWKIVKTKSLSHVVKKWYLDYEYALYSDIIHFRKLDMLIQHVFMFLGNFKPLVVKVFTSLKTQGIFGGCE